MNSNWRLTLYLLNVDIIAKTDLVDIKLVNNWVKCRIEIVEQVDNLTQINTRLDRVKTICLNSIQFV